MVVRRSRAVSTSGRRDAYASLVNVPATSGDFVRVFPAEQDLSLLYQKVAAKTEGFELCSARHLRRRDAYRPGRLERG